MSNLDLEECTKQSDAWSRRFNNNLQSLKAYALQIDCLTDALVIAGNQGLASKLSLIANGIRETARDINDLDSEQLNYNLERDLEAQRNTILALHKVAIEG